MRRALLVAAIGAASLAGWAAVAVRPADGAGEAVAARGARLHERPLLRRPIALAIDAAGRRLYAANQRSGSVSVIDTQTRAVVVEVPIGERLSDIAAVGGGERLVATDEEAGRLLVLRPDGDSLVVECEHEVPRSPVSVRVAEDGRTCYVASLWAGVLSVVELGESDPPRTPLRKGGSVRVRQTLELALWPREQLLIDGGRYLLVADSFQARFVVVEVADAVGRPLEEVRIVRRFSIPGSNVRGLALSPDGSRVLVAHVILNQLAETTRNTVFWGILLTNNLRALSLDSLLDPEAEPLADARVHFLGDPGNATGDPNAVVVTPAGDVLVALGGVGEVALGPYLPRSFSRTGVGLRPTDIVSDPQGRFAYVANTLSDSISVVDVASRQAVGEIPLGPQPELSVVDRGEMLFYDAELSLDGWFSCHSCHTDGHTNGLRADNLTDGTFGAAKRILSLHGVADTAPYAWNGRFTTLDEQVRVSITSTMQGAEPSDEQVAALTAYLESLAPLAPESPVPESGDESAVRGERLFAELGCASCHRPGTYTAAGVYDVGLDDGLGMSRFNPPSLRGLAYRRGLFHDNRAAGVREVLVEHGHEVPRELSEEEVEDLVRFLEGL